MIPVLILMLFSSFFRNETGHCSQCPVSLDYFIKKLVIHFGFGKQVQVFCYQLEQEDSQGDNGQRDNYFN